MSDHPDDPGRATPDSFGGTDYPDYCPRCGEVVAHYTAHQIMGQGEIDGYTCERWAPRKVWE